MENIFSFYRLFLMVYYARMIRTAYCPFTICNLVLINTLRRYTVSSVFFPKKMVGNIIIYSTRFLLRLRYKKKISGLKAVYKNGHTGIFFLANHPALIDPVLMFSILYPLFTPKAIADEYQVNRPIIGPLSRYLGVKPIPNLERSGIEQAQQKGSVTDDIINWLKNGDNVLLYPAGRIKRSYKEEIGATSSVKAILEALPEVRIILIRQNGLWGSKFSFGFNGQRPHAGKVLREALRFLACDLLFFMPRRTVEYEFIEAADMPRSGSRQEINAWLESFFNSNAAPNRYVPYYFWQGSKPEDRPDPAIHYIKGDAGSVPEATRHIVMLHLKELSGMPHITGEQRLNYDLGLDSLALADLNSWLEEEFGFSAGTPEALTTVNDVLLAAVGKAISTREVDIKPVPPLWLKHADCAQLSMPEGDTILRIFLKKAAECPSRAIIADQLSGVKTYRDVTCALLILQPVFQKLPGDYIGIMMPASATAAIMYLAVLSAGKTPVMVNWTTGIRNVQHSLDLLSVQQVITSRLLVEKLSQQGITCDDISGRFYFLEDLARRISLRQKMSGLLKSRISWKNLYQADVPDTAVILFTSGSENVPKAVPLTQGNLIANLRDISSAVTLRRSDSVIGFLPPFHSFGLTVTILLPLCYGMRAVFHANPTESAQIARLINAYKATLLVGTPTFLNGVMRAAEPGQLDSLRIAVTGAEKCSESVYARLQSLAQKVTVLEGYGVTECSPIIAVNREACPVPFTIGRTLPSYTYLIVDHETFKPLTKPDVAGLLLVRGPSVFHGYLHYGGPSPFIEAQGASWYNTGDLVSISADGIITFRGRLKRFVKIGGEMISLPAIESVLLKAFMTEDDEGQVCAVEAAGDEHAPEIVLFSVKNIDREQANSVIRSAGFSPIHNIRRVIRIESIPVLGNGKADYRKLKSML
ncbi:MAG: hypothetical protein C4541_05335 [Candidatus Auribacter fodinae]|uniref:Carrier domain-containing protein n=1 Tax=Candidatus Auribacter fodinae TaxID=2093366 RepID=A0A3A4RBW2_9BACT|nr:MAG: hypothetical protein C4541_05335 [Candidatus Auribacter fodinae]